MNAYDCLGGCLLLNEHLSKLDKLCIYLSALRKCVRGFVKGLFFKKRGGLLFVGKHVTLLNKQDISVGKRVKFEDFSEIQGLSTHGVSFADDVTIGRNVEIRPSSYYGVGDIGFGLTMGKNSSIGPGGYVGCAGSILIGENVMIGPRVTIIAENHNFRSQAASIKSQGVTQQGIRIEDNVWIGADVTILDGVTIGSGSVIGAATLVNKDVARNSVYFDKRTVYSRARD